MTVEWYHVSGDQGTLIASGTVASGGNTYVLTPADIGQTIVFEVSYTDNDGYSERSPVEQMQGVFIADTGTNTATHSESDPNHTESTNTFAEAEDASPPPPDGDDELHNLADYEGDFGDLTYTEDFEIVNDGSGSTVKDIIILARLLLFRVKNGPRGSRPNEIVTVRYLRQRCFDCETVGRAPLDRTSFLGKSQLRSGCTIIIHYQNFSYQRTYLKK